MGAELFHTSPPGEPETPESASPPRSEGAHDRAEIENSVLDALRPLMRPKRRKLADLPFAETLGAHERPEPTSGEADAPPRTFAEIGEDLDRRSRQSAAMVRLLEQHRQQLQTAEKERDDAYDKLAQVVPVVQALREAMDARQVDEDPARMHRLFMLNGRALDELEKVAVTLFADFLWVKSCWEQYGRTVDEARRLRAGLDA